MNVFDWVSLSSAAVCLCLGIVVYYIDRKALLNRLFVLASIAAFFYSFTTVMMWQSSNPESAYFWNKMGSVWPFFVALVTNFALVFTGSKWLKNKLTYLVLYLPALVFWIFEVSSNMINGPPIMKNWGYNDVPSPTWIYGISTLWSAVLPIIAFVLCFRYYQNTRDESLRQQRRSIAVGFAIPLVAFLVTNMLFRSIGVEAPNFGLISLSFFAGFVAYGMARHDLFIFDAALAAENILSTMPDSFILATMDGKILRVNKRLVDFLGYEEDELKGESILKLATDDRQWTAMLKELIDKRLIRNYEITCKTKNGGAKTVLFSGSIVRTKRKQDIGMTCIIHDMTKRKEREEKFMKAQRLASIGQLAGQVGHDLRNPLAAIKGAAFILGGENADLTQAKMQLALGVINDAVEDSNRIINGLIDYSSDLRLEISSCKLKPIVSRALTKVQVSNNIKTRNLVAEDASITVDAAKIERVFTDIIRNAVQAMPKGGKLEIQSTQEGARMEILFSDTGEGIPEKILSKMFSPLNTTKAKGMGLSLPICKRIIEAHDGHIIINSSIGRGTDVKIVFPSIKPTLDFEVGKNLVVNDNPSQTSCVDLPS